MKKRKCRRFNIPGTTLFYRKKPFLFFKTEYPNDCYPVVDISKGGTKFLCNQRLTPGRRFIIKVVIPGIKKPLEIFAKISWVARNREVSYKYQIGVSFNPYGTRRNNNSREILSLLEKLEKENSIESNQMDGKQTFNMGTDFAV